MTPVGRAAWDEPQERDEQQQPEAGGLEEDRAQGMRPF